jgi:protein TonB
VENIESRREEKAPAADPAQGYATNTTLSADPGAPEARLLSTGGEVHPGSAAAAHTTGPGDGRPGYGVVASLGRGAAGATSADGAGAGHAAVLRQIRDSVMKNVVYPERARRMGWEGKVIVSFTVHEDGSIHDARVAQSSGTPMLDEAAREALMNSSVKARFDRKVQVFLPVEYRLK